MVLASKINLTSKIVQYGKETNGYILKHGVMRENASSVFNGIGYIKHGGTKSIANQESRVLMLSEHARGDANLFYLSMKMMLKRVMQLRLVV